MKSPILYEASPSNTLFKRLKSDPIHFKAPFKKLFFQRGLTNQLLLNMGSDYAIEKEMKVKKSVFYEAPINSRDSLGGNKPFFGRPPY